MAYVPQFTGFSTPPRWCWRTRVISGEQWIEIEVTNQGTSNSSPNWTFTLPTPSDEDKVINCAVINNGCATFGWIQIVKGSSIATVHNGFKAQWTPSRAKGISSIIFKYKTMAYCPPTLCFISNGAELLLKEIEQQESMNKKFEIGDLVVIDTTVNGAKSYASGQFPLDKIYKVRDTKSSLSVELDGAGSKDNGWSPSYFKLATLEDIKTKKILATTNTAVRIRTQEQAATMWKLFAPGWNPPYQADGNKGFWLNHDLEKSADGPKFLHGTINPIDYKYEWKSTAIEFEEFMSKYAGGNEEIIGYELLKKYPGCTYNIGEMANMSSAVIIGYDKFPEFWKPVYKPKTKIVPVAQTNGGTFDVEILDGKAWFDGESYTKMELGRLITADIVGATKRQAYADSWSIGCKKGITRDSIERIVAAL